jgi:hypothetical protein
VSSEQISPPQNERFSSRSIVMSVEGIAMTPANSARIRDMIGRLPSGAPFKVSILRAGQVLELTGKAP